MDRKEKARAVDCRNYLEPSKGGMYCCPFCGSGTGNNKSGAVKYYEAKNNCFCHACHKPFDAVDLHMEKYGVNFQTAVEDMAGGNTSRSIPKKILPKAKKAGKKASPELDFLEYFFNCWNNLSEYPEAVAYLESRGISVETAGNLFVGFDPKADPANYPGGMTGELRFPCPRIIIPCGEHSYQGRAIIKTDYPKMGTPGTLGLFNYDAAMAKDDPNIFIVEGGFDALSVAEVGGVAIAVNGVGNAISKLLPMLKADERTPEKKIILCLDADEAGQNKQAELVELLREAYIPFVVSDISCGEKDPNEALVADRAAFSDAVAAAKRMRPELSVSLPDIVSFADVSGDKLPSRKPPLIADLLRCGHVGLVTGASKMGKTFLLMELAIAVCTGGRWLGHGCKQGRVLYCDFELDKTSFPNRINDQITVLGVDYSEVQANLDFMCLRGHLPTQEQFRHDLSLMTRGKDYILIIIDPVYKLLQGDENASRDVSQMFSYIQGISEDTGIAVVMCHHHSKGGQAGKNSMDRGSGSGAFAREPDCMIDMLELELTDTVREMYGFGDKPTVAFQLEYALREFPQHGKEYGFFRYPIHIPDSKGLLKDARTAREAHQKDTNKNNSRARQSYREIFAEVWEKLSPRGQPSIDAFLIGCRDLGVPVGTSDDAIKRQMKRYGYSIGRTKEEKGLVKNGNLEGEEDDENIDE